MISSSPTSKPSVTRAAAIDVRLLLVVLVTKATRRPASRRRRRAAGVPGKACQEIVSTPSISIRTVSISRTAHGNPDVLRYQLLQRQFTSH